MIAQLVADIIAWLIVWGFTVVALVLIVGGYGRMRYRAGWRARAEAAERHRFRHVVRVEVARRRRLQEQAAAETVRLPRQRVGAGK